MKVIEETYNWARTNFTEQKPDTIVIHHAAATNCTAQQIHSWHLARGWKGIAYHYFIRKDGSTYRGRQENHAGGHLLSSENNNTLGICIEGNYDVERSVPEAQLNALVELCDDIKTRWNIKSVKKHADYPSAKADNKLCPGKYFPWDAFITKIYGPTIMGEPELSSEQMRKFLRDVNPQAPEVEQIFLDEGRLEGVRGDIAFCQAIHETNYFRFTGTAKIEWHNPAGLGVTGPAGVGAKFPDWRTGIRAQIQHLKAYAEKNPVFTNALVDPRYDALVRAGYLGTAPRWTDLNGKWAYPGTSYGQAVLSIYDKVRTIEIDADSEKVKLLTAENERLKNENKRLQDLLIEIESIAHKR